MYEWVRIVCTYRMLSFEMSPTEQRHDCESFTMKKFIHKRITKFQLFGCNGSGTKCGMRLLMGGSMGLAGQWYGELVELFATVVVIVVVVVVIRVDVKLWLPRELANDAARFWYWLYDGRVIAVATVVGGLFESNVTFNDDIHESSPMLTAAIPLRVEVVVQMEEFVVVVVKVAVVVMMMAVDGAAFCCTDCGWIGIGNEAAYSGCKKLRFDSNKLVELLTTIGMSVSMSVLVTVTAAVAVAEVVAFGTSELLRYRGTVCVSSCCCTIRFTINSGSISDWNGRCNSIKQERCTLEWTTHVGTSMIRVCACTHLFL